jgi:Bacteriophage Rz lysis protein
MMSFLDPRVWLAFVLFGAVAFAAGDLGAHRKDKQKYDLIAAKADAAVIQAQSDADEKVASASQKTRDQIAAIEDNHQKETQDAETKIASLRDDVRSGAVRLSIATRAISKNVNARNSTVAIVDTETRSELMPEAANALISIAADGDAAVLDLNACIDSYNSARDEINKVAATLK